MKNLLVPTDRDEILERINTLSPNLKNQWGQMNVQQMLCHVTDPMRAAIGTRKVKPVIPPFLGFIMKPMLLSEKPFKQNLPTGKPYNQVKQGGTPPTTFENDKKLLVETINQFVAQDPNKYETHMMIGNISNEEYGKLMYKHADHHLRSFGV